MQSTPACRRGRHQKHCHSPSKTSKGPCQSKGRPTRLSQSSSDTAENSAQTSTDTEIYCLCHRSDDKRLMVHCDQYDCRYHGLCFGVSLEDVTTMDQFICPSCIGGVVIHRLCLFVQKRHSSRGGSIPAGPPFTGGRGESLPSPEAKKRPTRALFCLPITWVCCKDPDNAGPCHLGPSPSRFPEVCALPRRGPASDTEFYCGWPITYWEKALR